MSNRLSFAHLVPHREPREWMPAAAPSRSLAASALSWLHSLAATDDMPAAMRRDLGLPETAPEPVALAYEIERSRVRV